MKQKKLKGTVNSKTSQDERVDEKGNLTEGDSQTNLDCSQTELAISTCGAKPSDSNTDSTQPGESVLQNGRGEDQPSLKTRKTSQNFGKHRPVSNNNIKLRYVWCVAGLLIFSVALPPNHAAALPVNGHNTYEPGCSVAGSSREDDVLDSLDVGKLIELGLDRGSFNVTGRGYSRVCRDAFHDVCVEHVYLQDNILQDLPDGIFDYTTCLDSVYLSGNNFTKFPLALNSSTDIKLLDLSYNQISHIPRGTITGMTGLSTLLLSGNKNMTQAPEDTFYLKNHSLISVNLKMTQVQHPLVPPPQTMVCTNDNPCNVTHEEGSVWIRQMKGKKVTYEINQNGTMTCETLKQQLEANYEVLGGSIRCENKVLRDGTIKIVRKDQSDSASTGVSGDHGTTGVPTKQSNQGISSASTLSKGGICLLVFSAFVVGLGVKCCYRTFKKCKKNFFPPNRDD